MCSVSMIADYYERYNQPRPRPWNDIYPGSPGSPGIPMPGTLPTPVITPVTQWDEESKKLLREALAKLDQLDKRLGDLECKDEAKDRLKGIIGDWE